MANVYIDSAAAGAGTGADWANAYTTISAALAAKSAGDDFWIASTSAESTAGAITPTSPGTSTTPCRIISVNKAGSVPPVAADVTSGASVTTTGGSNITIGGASYYNGLVFNCGTGAVTPILTIGSTNATKNIFDNCDFIMPATGAGLFAFGGARAPLLLNNCRFKFGATTHRMYSNASQTFIRGGSIISGGSTPTSIFNVVSQGTAADVYVDGFDFSNLSATVNLVLGGASSAIGRWVFRNCKLPASWSGALVSTALTNPGARLEMYNCDDDTNLQGALWIEDYSGNIKNEATIVLTGGATNGIATYSWKMAANATAKFPLFPLVSPELFYWNTTTNVAKTLTVQVIHSGVGSGTAGALTDKDMWLDVQYLGATTSPLGSFGLDVAGASAGVASFNPLTIASDQPSAAATWTSSPATPQTQQLAVTFTPQEIGMYIARVYFTKASATVYVNPQLQIA